MWFRFRSWFVGLHVAGLECFSVVDTEHTRMCALLTYLLTYFNAFRCFVRTGPACGPAVCGGTTISCLLSLLVGQPLTPQLQQQAAAIAATTGGLTAGSTAFTAAAATAAVVRSTCIVLLGFGSTHDGTAVLVKAGVSCLPELAKAVRASIVSARRETETQQQRQLNSERLAAVLQLLAVLAGRPEGQRALLRPTVAPAVLELCAEVLQLPQQPAAAAAALLLLRNLAFNPDARSPLLANGALLPLLLAAAESCLAGLSTAERQQWQQRMLAESGDKDLGPSAAAAGGAEGACECRPQKWDPTGGGIAANAARAAAGGSSGRVGGPPAAVGVSSAAGNVCCAVYAVSALWALVHSGERVKAALRKLPAAAARLAVVKAHAEQLQHTLQQQEGGKLQLMGAPGGVSAAVAAADGDSGAVAVAVGSMGGPGHVQGERSSRLGPAGPTQHQQVVVAAQAGAMVSSGAAAGGGGGGVAAEVQLRSGVEGGVWVGPSSLGGVQDVAWWLQQLQDSCGALLDLMDAC
jgi:hypothetical protein